MTTTPKIDTCIYNEGINCKAANCTQCGWNPEVAAKRTHARKLAELQARFPGQKLYKIPFTGYCEVWAKSRDEAIENAGNEDMFFVRYEFEKPTCLTKEDENEMD